MIWERIMAHGNQKVSDPEILALFDATDDPYLTATEIADILDIRRQTAHERLMDLWNNGEIRRKKTGRTVGWWKSDN